MNLFQSGDFWLHSGDFSSWKIDCDALSDSDLATLAAVAVRNLVPFYGVAGIPSGGLRFAGALESFVDKHASRFLIVDDVLTTGASMSAWMRKLEEDGCAVTGLVIFARKQPPIGVEAIFKLPYGWK